MATAVNDAQRQSIASHCRAGSWVGMRPTLLRLGEGAQADAEVVVDWLAAASSGSFHEAQRALRAMGLYQWTLAPAATGALRLQAGAQAWQLTPMPATRPLTWRVAPLVEAA